MIRAIFIRLYDALSGHGMGDVGARGLHDGDTRDARDVAARFSRGSVAIQEEAFLTTGDLERERAYARSHPLPN